MTDPVLTTGVIVLVPASIVFAALMGYWVGRTLERNSDRPEASDSDTDVDVVDRLPDEVFLARVQSAIGGERHLVIIDDGRTPPEATRELKRQFPNADVQQVSHVRVFEFDDDDDQDPSVTDANARVTAQNGH